MEELNGRLEMLIEQRDIAELKTEGWQNMSSPMKFGEDESFSSIEKACAAFIEWYPPSDWELILVDHSTNHDGSVIQVFGRAVKKSVEGEKKPEMPKGQYTLTVIFSNRQGEEKKLDSTLFLHEDSTFARAERIARADIVSIGLHNFGMYVGSARSQEITFFITGPTDTSPAERVKHTGTCRLDSGGHITRE